MPPINIEYFLNSPEGQDLGGLDAGFNYLEDTLYNSYGINLAQSLKNECGIESPNTRVKIRAKNVSFDSKENQYKSNVYILYDPKRQSGYKQDYEMPIVTLKSFNDSLDLSISSMSYFVGRLKEFREKMSNLSPEEIRKKSYQNAQKHREESERIRMENAKKMAEKEKLERKEAEYKKAKSYKTWNNGEKSENSNNPYFKKKGMSDIHQLIYLKTGKKEVELQNRKFTTEVDMIPLFKIKDSKLKMVNYQEITKGNEKQHKMLAAGMELKGVFNIIGCNPDLEELSKYSQIHIAEGLANSYYVNKITGEPCIFAINSNNIENVLSDLRNTNGFENTNIIIAADNDKHKPHSVNTGLKKGTHCAIDYNTSITFPIFKKEDDNKKLTDWDDFVRQYGIESAREAYMSSNNSMSFNNTINEVQKSVYKDIFDVKYASQKNVWDQIQDFILPKEDNTEPSLFEERVKVILKHIPENAFKKFQGKETINGENNYNYTDLPGKRFTELSFEDLVNIQNHDLNKLDSNSKSFIENKIIPYIDKNETYFKSFYNDKRESEENINHLQSSNLTKEETKILLNKVLSKGINAEVTTIYPFSSTVNLTFFISNLENDVVDNVNTIKSFKDINGNQGHKIDIQMQVENKEVILWNAIGDGKSKLKNVMKKQLSKELLSGKPEISSFHFNNKKVDIEKVEFSDNALREVVKYLLSNVEARSNFENKKKHDNLFHISNVSTYEGERQERKKNFSYPNLS